MKALQHLRIRGSKTALTAGGVALVLAGGLGGVGEVGTPCVAPAIANACARIAGASRHRSLPFFPGATMGDL